MIASTRCFNELAILSNDSLKINSPLLASKITKIRAKESQQLLHWRKLIMNNISLYLSNTIDASTITKAEAQNADAIFQIGFTHLKHNRAGFARSAFQHAAKIGHEMAKQYLAILEDRKISVKERLEKILNK